MKTRSVSLTSFLIISLTFTSLAIGLPMPASFVGSIFERAAIAQGKNVGYSRIKDFQRFDLRASVVFTSEAIYITADSGATWAELDLPRSAGETIASVYFENESTGTVLLFDAGNGRLRIGRTSDGGNSWFASPVTLPPTGIEDLDLENARVSRKNGNFEIEARIPTSSNFDGRARFVSDDGDNWELASKSVVHRLEPASVIERDGDWRLQSSGECFGFKSGCIQTDSLLIAGNDVTPPAIKAAAERQREAARAEYAKTQQFALPPGGSVRTSLNRGFDKCTNGSVSQMQTWWDNSYFFDANIYFSGRNRACSQTLSASWVNQVSAQGWGLIPTVVGYQSPCTSSTTSAKFSYDTATAETQGRGEADIAAADANNLGLTAGSILYYDMERYDETAATPGCRAASTAFLKGWTKRIRELGYRSGVYGSPRNAIDDWQFMPAASRMDAVWMARWDNVPSVWTYVSFADFPSNVWNNHQRIKQWQAPHNETWGGVTFNIDGNIADGPVGGVPVPKNKVADFDGDGKTDVSVFRPSTGQWFVAGTLGPSFNIYEYGTAEDILTPGDYDGDGRTDLVVFRPSNSTWYLRMKGLFQRTSIRRSWRRSRTGRLRR